MILRDLFDGGNETLAMFVCIDVCVGSVCLYNKVDRMAVFPASEAPKRSKELPFDCAFFRAKKMMDSKRTASERDPSKRYWELIVEATEIASGVGCPLLGT